MSNDEFASVCYLIDPAIDWTKLNYSHLESITIDIKPNITRQKLKEIITSRYWPEAIPPSLIVHTEEARQHRANTIITSYCGNDLHGKRFLDFGCGNGDCVKAAAELGATAIGFDIIKHSNWDFGSRLVEFSDNPTTITANAPYDIILLYDVLDYMIENGQPKFDLLKKIPKLLSPTGKVYARCRPYSARTIHELYLTNNKAFIHLFIPPSELGVTLTPGFMITNPNAIYQSLFNRCGFTIIKAIKIRQKVEAIIRAMIPTIMPSILADWKSIAMTDISQIADTMEIQYIDFVLDKS